MIQNSLSGWTAKETHNLAYLLPVQRQELPRTFEMYSLFFEQIKEHNIEVPKATKLRNEGDAFRLHWTTETFIDNLQDALLFVEKSNAERDC